MLCLMMAVSLLMQQESKEREIEAKLKNLRLTLDFKDATLDQLMDYVREVADLNVVVSSKVEKRDGFTIKVTDLPLKSILTLVLKPRDLIWLVKDGVLTIATREEEPVVLEIYELHDLLYSPPDMPGVEKTLDGSMSEPFVEVTPVEFPIVELVKGHTGGKSWDENARASITLTNGLLVVKQTKAVHRQIRRMLNEMRR